MLLAPLAAPLVDVIPASAAPGKMVLSIHQTTSQRAGYRKILEGWAKAGIKYVEITDRVLDDFLKTDSLAAAKSVITDNGLTMVSGASVLQDFWNKNPGFDAQMEETLRAIRVARIDQDLLPQHHESKGHRGRLQDRSRRYPRSRRRGQTA